MCDGGMQSRFHRSDGDVHDLPDLVQRQSFQVREQQHRAKVLGQLRERPLQVEHGHDRRIRRLPSRALLEAIVHILVEEHRLVRLPPVEREERVSQYLEQPSPQVRSRLEPMREPEGAEVGLLDQVVGVRRPLGQPEGEVIERVEVREGLLAEFGGRLGHGVASGPGR